MATSKKAVEEADLFDGDFAPSIRFLENEVVMGKFLRLEMGPDLNNGYDAVPIVVLEGISGKYETKGGEIVDIVPGKEYSVWLFGGVLQNRFPELAPGSGERVAIRYNGMVASQTRTDKNGNAAEYHSYSVSCPDRVRENREINWDDLSDVNKVSQRTF